MTGQGSRPPWPWWASLSAGFVAGTIGTVAAWAATSWLPWPMLAALVAVMVPAVALIAWGLTRSHGMPAPRSTILGGIGCLLGLLLVVALVVLLGYAAWRITQASSPAPDSPPKASTHP